MFTKVGEGNVVHLKAEIFCSLTSPPHPSRCSVLTTTPGSGTQHCPMVKRLSDRRKIPRAKVIISCDLGQVLDLPKSVFSTVLCPQWPRTFDLSSPLIWEASQSSRKQGKVNALGKSAPPGAVLPGHLAFSLNNQLRT